MASDTCEHCGGERPDRTIPCPHCVRAGARRDASGSADLVAVLVVLFLLVVVGHYVMAAGSGVVPAKASAEAAGRAGAVPLARPAPPMENPAAARIARGLPSAPRAAPAARR